MNLNEEVIGFGVVPLDSSNSSLINLCSMLIMASGWPGDTHLPLYRELGSLVKEIQSSALPLAPIAISVLDPVRFWVTAAYDRESLSELRYDWDWPLENRPLNTQSQSTWCRLGYMIGDSLFGGSSIADTVSLAEHQGLLVDLNVAVELLALAEANDPDWDKHVFGVYSTSPELLDTKTRLSTVF